MSIAKIGPILATIGFVVTVPAMAQSIKVGAISGQIIGDDGLRLQGTVVANGFGVVASGRASSASDGTFTISNLPPGSYDLCVRTTTAGYLDPCSWEPTISKAVVTAGQTTTGVRVIAPKGGTINVQVSDPLSVLGASTSVTGTSPSLLIGVITSKGLFEPLKVVNQTATGSSLQATIPFNSQVMLSVAGQQIAISNGGTPLNASGSSIPITQTSSGPSTSITLQVSKP